MLIQALCDYYDILAEEGKLLPEEYSEVNIQYLICLNAGGGIDKILDIQRRETITRTKGKIQERLVPKTAVMPRRTEKPGIDSNIIEHRPLYLFGLNYAENGLNPDDRTGKAKKSHDAFVEKNLQFIEEMDSPVINAYRNFLQNWKPAEETKNAELLKLGKEYEKSAFAFCLTGYPDHLLHEEPQIREKWRRSAAEAADRDTQGLFSQCAVSGRNAPIARIHGKIRGVAGSLPTGSVLIGFNNSSENSYGREQSYNSNLSFYVMQKYTAALNYLLGSAEHKFFLEDITIVFWAMNPNPIYEDLVMAMLFGKRENLDAGTTEQMLKRILPDAKSGKLTEERLRSLDLMPNVNFYMLGLKPNASRLSVKFIYKNRFAAFLWNAARFQSDLQISKKPRLVSLAAIGKELALTRSQSKQINPALLGKLLEAVIYGRDYPASLLETAVRRTKTDINEINGISMRTRMGIIKASINRNEKKEELKVSLDKENHGQAYLCGRLFAVLERLQQSTAKILLNRTIRDTYFASASSKPAMTFPKLLRLAQYHMSKLKNPIFYNRLICEITDQIDGEFPETFSLQDQGRFMIGYYQQYQSFLEKKQNESETEMEENADGN